MSNDISVMKRSAGKPRVVIVGSGPTGLATALELGTRGVECLIVERNPERGHAPRAKTTHAPTGTSACAADLALQMAKADREQVCPRRFSL